MNVAGGRTMSRNICGLPGLLILFPMCKNSLPKAKGDHKLKANAVLRHDTKDDFSFLSSAFDILEVRSGYMIKSKK